MGGFFTLDEKALLNFTHCSLLHPARIPFYGQVAETQRGSIYLAGVEQNINSWAGSEAELLPPPPALFLPDDTMWVINISLEFSLVSPDCCLVQ